MRPIRICALLLLTPLAHLDAQQAAVPEPQPLFSPAASAPSASSGLAQAARERRAIDLSLELLGTPIRVGAAARIRLDLFGGDSVVVRHESTEAAFGGGFLWTGTIEEEAEGDVVLSVTQDVVVGSIRWGEQLIRISPAGSGLHWLTRVDEGAFPGCATVQAAGPGSSTASNTASSGPPVEAGAAPNIDVLVVYSSQAMASAGGANAMNSLINLAVTETNQAYAACGVTQRLVLVHTEEMLGYVEPGSFSTILSDLTSPTNGKLDEVHALRDTYGADAVAMICNNGQYCGQAHLMTNVGPGFQNRAFSVTNYSCATGYYSFGHELGHNFGSHHDPANAGGAAYSYSYGYRTPDNQFRTIMAYAPGTRVKRFSSPNATWQGNTMGNASQDNARSLNDTAATVAAWRASVPLGSTLATTPMTAGAEAVISIGNATPFGPVLLGYSLTGGGPTATPYGSASLTPPIRLLRSAVARENGSANVVTVVPPGTSGLTIWLQAYDPTSGLLGNGIQSSVQ